MRGRPSTLQLLGWIQSPEHPPAPGCLQPPPRAEHTPRAGSLALPQALLCPQETGNNEVLFMHLDLASLRSVRAFASAFLRQEPHLHLLINNAGECRDPKSPLHHRGTTMSCHCLLIPQG